jgi:hypothetical protein
MTMKTQLVAVTLLVNLFSAGAALAANDETQAIQPEKQIANVNQPCVAKHNKHERKYVIKNATIAGDLYNMVFPPSEQPGSGSTLISGVAQDASSVNPKI